MPAGSRMPRYTADDRYEIYGEIGSGGMAVVEYARLIGPHGFTRACAIKRLHPHFAKDPSFVDMLIDEARLSAQLQHANIVPTIDVIARPGELALVMEYVHGEPLSKLLQLSQATQQPVPVPIATWLMASVAHGLHAAHEARDANGQLLGVVHRDVSPHNILVGADGVPRIVDFGIAKAVHRLRVTPAGGEIKGKLRYIAPEQLENKPVDRRSDVYGVAAVLWESLTGVPLFDGTSESAVVHAVLHAQIAPPSQRAAHADVPPELDAIVLRGLARDPAARFATAEELAGALERIGTASQSQARAWIMGLAGEQLARRLQSLQMRETPTALPAGPGASAEQGTRRISLEPTEESTPEPPPSATGIRRRGRPAFWPWGVLGLTVAVLAAVLAVALAKPQREEERTTPVVQVPEAVVAPAPAPTPAPASMIAPPAAATPSAVAPVPPAAKHATPKIPKARAHPTTPPAAETPPPPPAAQRKCPPFVYRDGIRYQNEACLDGRTQHSPPADSR